MKIYEQYYEFKVGTSLLVRIWIKGYSTTTLDFCERAKRLREEIMLRFPQGSDCAYIADNISGMADIAAVHVQDESTGFGNVIYNDWP